MPEGEERWIPGSRFEGTDVSPVYTDPIRDLLLGQVSLQAQ